MWLADAFSQGMGIGLGIAVAFSIFELMKRFDNWIFKREKK